MTRTIKIWTNCPPALHYIVDNNWPRFIRVNIL